MLVTNLQEVPETTSACALQKAATLSLATARVEEHVAQHVTVAPILGRFTKNITGDRRKQTLWQGVNYCVRSIAQGDEKQHEEHCKHIERE